MIDEACEEIEDAGVPIDDPRRVSNASLQVKFAGPDDHTSSSKRDGVPRMRMLAPREPAARRHVGPASRTLLQRFFRFAHGAYVDIMELFSSGPSSGLPAREALATASMAEAVRSQANYLVRSLLAVELLARRAHRADVVEQACGMAAELARRAGCLDTAGIATIEARRFGPK
jgi:hypothetical protein